MKAGTWPLTRRPLACAYAAVSRSSVLRERVVDLDLRVAVGGVPVDRLLGFVEVLDDEAVARRHLALAFDEAGGHHARRHQRAGVLLDEQLLQRRVVVAHVAHGGDAGGEVEAAVPAADVAVHVEQARQQHAAVGLDDVVGRVGRSVRPGPDRHDAAVAHQHVGGRAQGRVLAVEHARVADHACCPRADGPGASASSTSTLPSACFCCASSAAALPCQPSSISCRKPGKMKANRRGDALGGGPGERRRQARRRSARPVARCACCRSARRGHLRLADLAHGQRAARDQRQLAVGALGQRARTPPRSPAGVPPSGEYSAVPDTTCCAVVGRRTSIRRWPSLRLNVFVHRRAEGRGAR